MANKLKVGACS